MSLDSLPLFSSALARQSRDAGISRAIDNGEDYYTAALRILPALRASIGEEFQGEDIRAALVRVLGQPHSHKLWGAITQGAIKRGLIVGTGQYPPCRSEKTHAHRTQLYRWAA